MINFFLILRHDEIEGKNCFAKCFRQKKEDSHFVPFSTIKWQMKEMVIDLQGILLHDRSLHDEYLVLF